MYPYPYSMPGPIAAGEYAGECVGQDMAEYAGQTTAEYSGLDISAPPWWGVFPIAAPAAAAKWGTDLYSRNIGSSSSLSSRDVQERPQGPSPWPAILKVALVVGGALAVYGIYRASVAAEKLGGPIHERVGEAAVKMLKAKGGPARGKYAGAITTEAEDEDVEVLPAKRTPVFGGMRTIDEGKLLPA